MLVVIAILSTLMTAAICQTTCSTSGLETWLLHGLWTGQVANSSNFAYAVGSTHTFNFTGHGFRYVAGAKSGDPSVFPSLSGAKSPLPPLNSPMARYDVGRFVSAWPTSSQVHITMPAPFNNQIWPCVWFVTPNKQALRLVCAGVGDNNWSIPAIFGWPKYPQFPDCPQGSLAPEGCVSFLLSCALPNGCCDRFY